MDCREYRELIAAHVDGALSLEERLAVESHLDQCSKCAAMWHWELSLKGSLKRKLSVIPVRPALKQRVLDQLGDRSGQRFLGWFSMPHAWVVACALLLIFLVPYLVRQGEDQEDIFGSTITQYRKVTEGTGDASSLTPPARLLDLSPWGYQIVEKQARFLGGKERRVFVYRGPAKEILLAQEFDGAKLVPPSGSRSVQASNKKFVTYSRNDVNLVAWQERDFICILTSSLPEEGLLQLALQVAARS